MIKTGEFNFLADNYQMEDYENMMIRDERENILKLSNDQMNNGKYPFYLNSILANNMDTYLQDCRYLISEKIQKVIPDHTFHRKRFERISEWEILEYRYMLEKDIERGIHALNQVR